MPVVDLYRDCPGYAEAARRERELRDVPFLGLPENVAGIPCAPLTLRRVMWLQMVKSPFLMELPADLLEQKPDILADIGLFFWITSQDFKPGNEHRKTRRFRQLKSIGKKPVSEVAKEISEYMKEAFMDAGHRDGGKSYFSQAASLILFLTKNFGLDCDVWENSAIRNFVRRIMGRPNPLDIPLRVAWQLLRANHASQHADVIFSNPISDEAVRQWQQNLKKEPARFN